MSDAVKLAVLAGAMIVAGLMALYRKGPTIPKPEWPPSPTWSSRRDLLFAITSTVLLGMGVLFAALSVLAIALSGGSSQG